MKLTENVFNSEIYSVTFCDSKKKFNKFKQKCRKCEVKNPWCVFSIGAVVTLKKIFLSDCTLNSLGMLCAGNQQKKISVTAGAGESPRQQEKN